MTVTRNFTSIVQYSVVVLKDDHSLFNTVYTLTVASPQYSGCPLACLLVDRRAGSVFFLSAQSCCAVASSQRIDRVLGLRARVVVFHSWLRCPRDGACQIIKTLILLNTFIPNIPVTTPGSWYICPVAVGGAFPPVLALVVTTKVSESLIVE